MKLRGAKPRKPLVSVFIQTYQHAPFIRDAVDGVLAQEVDFELELVIADDCSTDGTRDVLHEYRDRHPDQIRLLLPERNLGPTEIFRRSVGELRGEYVAWLDGDDYWTDERKLAKQVEALRQHPGWAACFHNATIVQDGDEGSGRPYVLDLGAESVGFGELMRSNHVPSLSLMTRGELVRGLPEWVWETLWSDWMAVMSIALHGEIGYLPESMGVYRMHGGGVSSGRSRAAQLEADLGFFATLRKVAGEEHRGALEEIVRERHCQLVVERLDLPFAGAIAVLGRRAETPTELNGRQVWPLAIEEEELAAIDQRDRDGSLARQLERFRLAAPEAQPGLAHFEDGERVPEANGEPALRLLAVGPMCEWLDGDSRLGRQLEGHCETLWEDEVCAVREVAAAADAPLPCGCRAEVKEVAMLPPPPELFGCHLDLPRPGRRGDAHSFDVAGWAIGADVRPAAVEVVQAEELLGRIPVDLPRPDLEAAFPERGEIPEAGFHGTLSLVGRNPAAALEVRVVLEDERRVPIGRLTWERSWRSADNAAAPLVSVVVASAGASAAELEATLASVRAQTYAKLEIAVCERAEEAETSGELVVPVAAGESLEPRALERRVEAAQPRLAT